MSRQYNMYNVQLSEFWKQRCTKEGIHNAPYLFDEDNDDTVSEAPSRAVSQLSTTSTVTQQKIEELQKKLEAERAYALACPLSSPCPLCRHCACGGTRREPCLGVGPPIGASLGERGMRTSHSPPPAPPLLAPLTHMRAHALCACRSKRIEVEQMLASFQQGKQ